MGDVVDHKLKLYIRLPVKIVDELQVKELHPAITRVYLPRQKARRWCFVAFEDEQSLLRAQKELRSKIIDGKKIFIGNNQKEGPYPQRKEKKARVPAESMLDLIKEGEKQ